MRTLIGIGIVVVSIIAFGWWGLLSLIIALPFIGWQDRHKGPFPLKQRWSLCFSFNGDVIYELTHERAGVLLGYVMLRFYKYKSPKSEQEIHLVFNKKDTAIKLEEKYFQNDQMPERDLYILMESIDPDHSNFGNSSIDPVFFSRSPYKIIPLQSDLSFQEMIENPGKASSIVTFGDKMDEVFG